MVSINRCRLSLTIAALLLAMLTTLAPANAAIIKTDIVMIVDESGSMSNIHNNLGNSIGQFASLLQAGGLDVQFSLIGYGFAGDTIRLLTDFVDAPGFASATADLFSLGANEPAYDATAYALDELNAEQAGLSFRADAVKNIILFADEASNSDQEHDVVTVDTLLKQHTALFNVVLSGTFDDLLLLAANNGGQGFDLNELNTSDVALLNAFVTNFAQVKLQETLDFCVTNPDHPACGGDNVDSVPAPAGIGLIAIGIMVVSFRNRK